MPPFGPISRVNLIRNLRALGFDGPYSGGNHAYMIRGARRIAIPNPHQGMIGVNLLERILRQANVTREDWEAV
jgi:predicted RNA binding protein YcfA (HicA-like mRNA interferase family)